MATMQHKIFCVYQRRMWDEFKRVLSIAHASQPVERAENLENRNQLSGVCWGAVYCSTESIFLNHLYSDKHLITTMMAGREVLYVKMGYELWLWPGTPCTQSFNFRGHDGRRWNPPEKCVLDPESQTSEKVLTYTRNIRPLCCNIFAPLITQRKENVYKMK